MEQTTPPALVDLSRDVDASPKTVWSILTTPSLFSAWIEAKVDFESRVGSPFRADFPQFETVITGEVRHLDHAVRHLGITWGVVSGPQADSLPAGSSLVEFRVVETESGCRVELTHSRLPSEEAAREHEGGWRFHLSRLALRANRSDLEKGLERTLEGWFAAWNQKDDEKRLETLRGCCAEDIVFKDDWAVADGLDLLSLHVGNCFRFMPEWSLEPTGDVRICRGEALVGWRSVGPDGTPLEGFNHISANHDGTIRRVTGFQKS